MSENKIDKAWASMAHNLEKKTGKNLDEWIRIIDAEPLTRTSDKVKFLKKEYGMGQGYAGLIIYNSKIRAAGGPDSPETLIERQYTGKEQLKPIYDKLIAIAEGFGDDLEVAPRNSYVSLRRNVQFAMLTPASKVRFDLALKLKDQPAEGILEELPAAGMCTHKIKINKLEDITPEVIAWLKLAYDKAN
ncbi:MAG TPA: DUF5655 domain-containing protein [Candidatus Cloacimonadota bacterium]|nr:DUF5655 domain-containing protein [Candidatus Cloacimonadota bacterium]